MKSIYRHLIEITLIIVCIGVLIGSSVYVVNEFVEAAIDTSVPRVRDNPFYAGCGQSKLCLGSPRNCFQNENCKAAVSVQVKDGTYTFEMIATGETGKEPAYIAVGLSSDKLMGSDSSMECQREGDIVTVQTSWTYPKEPPYTTREDVSQDILHRINSSYIDGTINCKFTRDVESTVKGVKFNLADDKYYLLLVSGLSLRGNFLVGYHDIVCDWSSSKVSLSSVRQLAAASRIWLKFHAILMVIAWIGTTSVGIVIARHFKNTWMKTTKSGKELWFAWHMHLMTATWVLTMASFIIIVVDVGGWTTIGGDNPHAILGMTTIVICFLQPFGAVLRNKLNETVFHWTHLFFGNAAHILSIVTIYYGVRLSQSELPEWTYLIITVFVIFYLAVHLVFTMLDYIGNKDAIATSINLPNGPSDPPEEDSVNNAGWQRKAKFRKSFLILHATVTTWVAIAIIALISLSEMSV